jgi:hypothetical protein
MAEKRTDGGSPTIYPSEAIFTMTKDTRRRRSLPALLF